MQTKYITSRLELHKLTEADHKFIYELVNSPNWLEFISDGKTKTEGQTSDYIQKIIDNPTCTYWVVKLQAEHLPIGVITFMKRNYLEYYDIGFAFLPQKTKQGYAFEATAIVLSDALTTMPHILAVTVPHNIKSIRLLEKLGFCYSTELIRENERLLLYSITI